MFLFIDLFPFCHLKARERGRERIWINEWIWECRTGPAEARGSGIHPGLRHLWYRGKHSACHLLPPWRALAGNWSRHREVRPQIGHSEMECRCLRGFLAIESNISSSSQVFCFRNELNMVGSSTSTWDKNTLPECLLMTDMCPSVPQVFKRLTLGNY